MKGQKWLLRILVGMLVGALVLSTTSLIFALGGPDKAEPEDTCPYFQCQSTNVPCYWNGYAGYYEICHYVPYPDVCPRCPYPCEWVQCRWW